MHTSKAQSHAKPDSRHHAGRSAASAAPAATAAQPRLYNPRHPECTLLYQTIADRFKTWHELASAGQFDGQDDHQTPKPFVRQALRKYPERGIFAHGFARACCDDCGHDYFVAFSCKDRNVCPSCNTRRMVGAAAHLTDHVFARLPVRHWVQTAALVHAARGWVGGGCERSTCLGQTCFEAQSSCHTWPHAVEFPIYDYAIERL